MAISRLQQARQMRKGGGIMGSNAGSMLVAPTRDGSRPGYYGPDAGHANDPGHGKNDPSPGSDKGHSRFDSHSGYYGNRRGSTFETYRDGKSIGVDNTLKAKYGTTQQQKEAQKALDKGFEYSPGPSQNVFQKMNTWNVNFQKAKNIELARKRAFQKYKDLEKYVHGDFDMDYDFTVDIYGNKVPKGLEYLVSNKGTSIESKRKNLYDVAPKSKYSVTQALLDAFRPDTQVTLENTLNKARAYNQLAMDPNISKEKLDALANLGKTPDQINPPTDRNGDNPPYIIPTNYYTSAAPLPIDAVEEEKTFDYRFGNPNENEAADVTQGFYAAQGGRVPKAFGGIMDTATGRKRYFLGSIGDAIGDVVGGVADAAGKVLKSDLGKAAVAAAAFYYGGGGGNPFTAAGRAKFSPSAFFSKANPLLFTKNKFDPLKMAGLITLGGAAMGPAKVDKMPGLTERGGRLIDPLTGEEATPAQMRASINAAVEEAQGDPVKLAAIDEKYNNMLNLGLPDNLPYPNYALFASGGRVPAQEGGLMDLGGMEKDYRNEGGFVPIGREEKADDVPARLSVNEFVFTADAVRGAGGGDIDKGAEIMENVMKNLENGGRISEESQGNAGAQQMFSVSERIGEVI